MFILKGINMKQIRKPIELIEKVLGNQKYDESVSYRFSYSCLFYEIDDGYLLYNHLTFEFIILEKNELESLRKSHYKRPHNIAKKLVERYFLVPLELEEYKLCDQIKEFTKSFLKQDKSVNKFNILPTTACNARCFYCFEAGASKINMDEKTALAVVDYIEKKYTLALKVCIAEVTGQEYEVEFISVDDPSQLRAMSENANKINRNEIFE